MDPSNQLPSSLQWIEKITRYEGNPILRPQGKGYAADLIFNPGAIVKDDTVMLLCRGVDFSRQPSSKSNWSVSSMGWARSKDGFNFTLDPEPIPEFTIDENSPYQGGFEDARLVKIGDEYVLTYTGVYDCTKVVGMAAFSKDLEHWELAGEILPGRAIAITDRKINGKYYAYWDNSDIRLAVSDDLRHWEVLPQSAIAPRPGMFDEQLCEATTAPLITDDGILLIYHGACNRPMAHDYSRELLPGYWGDPDFIYRLGWVLFDRQDPTKVIARSDKPFFGPEKLYELFGMSNFAIFCPGIVKFKGKYIFYYGCGDARISCAYVEVPEDE